jgi:hypothetical protein
LEPLRRAQYNDAVSPGGHLATTLVACAATAALTDSVGVMVGVAVGGFLIDIDHAIDYVLVERQRDLRPSAFLRYYLEARVRRAVLVFHSYECFALVGVVAWWTDWLPLWGYLVGAILHLALDIAFNGQLVPTNILAFYSFTYRARHRFCAVSLHGGAERAPAPRSFWRAFFKGAATVDQ